MLFRSEALRQAQSRQIGRHLKIDVDREGGGHGEIMRRARRTVDGEGRTTLEELDALLPGAWAAAD